ncbi:MAG: hypothetical protein A4S09_16440 [Proteobacteria bacterium SG_bin7]|nr:MAG: hypothetical protein A4S09_16440 [Proteobacteria bacterium SG_bin7]
MEIRNNHTDFNINEFEPAVRRTSVQRLTRPSLSYWGDAWIRLKKNTAAMLSLFTIIAMILFSAIGPMIWNVDPTLQNLGRISEDSSFGKKAVVIKEKPSRTIVDTKFPVAPEKDNPQIKSPKLVEIVGVPTTLAVEIKWQPVEGAKSYEIFRSDEPPEGFGSMGLPLKDILGGNRTNFIDELKLKDTTYYYTVVAHSLTTRSEEFQTVKVDVRSGVLLVDALKENANLKEGDEITLSTHPLGTDYLGRDSLARLMYGGRVSLFIGIVAPLLFILLGTILGGIAGYIGGKVDIYIMRVSDIISSLPFLLVMIIMYVVFAGGDSQKSIFAILIAMVTLFWPGTARLVRGQVLQIREEGYVQAAKLLGVNTSYLIMRHMVPNTMGVILVTLTFAVPTSIFTEAFLSFVGMGVKPPNASWGSLCEEGVKSMLTSPHELFWPALFISITTLSFNLLGDGLRDALDARMRSRE